jgi:hypothetical protein
MHSLPEGGNVGGGVVNDVLQGSDQQADHEEEVHDDVVVVPESEIPFLKPINM